MTPQSRAEHDELRQAMRRYAELMRKSSQANYAALSRERVLFSQKFSAHVANEARQLSCSAYSHSDYAPLIKTYNDKLTVIRRSYSSHVVYWTPAMICSDWRNYVASVLKLQSELTALLLWKEHRMPAGGQPQERKALT